jgi:hypothetical protein
MALNNGKKKKSYFRARGPARKSKLRMAPDNAEEAMEVEMDGEQHGVNLEELNPAAKLTRNGTKKREKKLHGLSPRANYTDRETAACRRSDCQLLRIKGATCSA